MTGVGLPPDTRARLRAALRANAGRWIAANYRHQLLVARGVKGMQTLAVDDFQREVVAPAVRAVAGGLAGFEDRGPAVVIDQFPDLAAMAREVRGIVTRGSATVRARTTIRLADLAAHEVEWAHNTATRVLKVGVPSVNAGAVVTEALARPFLGQKLDAWFGDMLAQPAAKNALQWVQTGINQGLSTDAIVKGLRGTASRDYLDGWLSGSSRDLTTLVRTAGTHFSSTANGAAMKALGIERYRWLDTLDTRTCVVCGNLAKQSVDEGGFILGEGPMPPSHPRCRCVPAPWLGEPEGTRASQDGQVPAELTLPDWIEGRSAAEQDRVLGKTVGRAYRAGKITFDQTINERTLEPLTIDEMRRLDRLLPEEE